MLWLAQGAGDAHELAWLLLLSGGGEWQWGLLGLASVLRKKRRTAATWSRGGHATAMADAWGSSRSAQDDRGLTSMGAHRRRSQAGGPSGCAALFIWKSSI